MNEIAKRSICDRLIKAISDEGLKINDAGRYLGIAPTYVSMMRNPLQWHKCGSTAWEAARKWSNSGESLRVYWLKQNDIKGKEISIDLDKDEQPDKKKSGIVPGNPTERKDKKPYEPPTVTRKEVEDPDKVLERVCIPVKEREPHFTGTPTISASKPPDVKRKITIAMTVLMVWFLFWLIVSVHTITDDIHFTGEMLLDGILVAAFGLFWIQIRAWIVKSDWRLV